MEENNRKGPGVFYAVVGVATLVVAIVGATFAYFSAAATDDTDTVEGTTASAGSLTLTVSPVYPVAVEGAGDLLIPLDEEAANGGASTGLLTKALNGSCRDVNKDVACQVYSVTVTNGGTAAVLTSTKLSLAFTGTNNDATNWRMAVLTGTEGSFAASDTIFKGTALTATEANAPEIGNTTLTATGSAGASATYYVVIWLEDNNQPQTETSVTFNGTVSASSVGANGEANGVTATFAA